MLLLYVLLVLCFAETKDKSTGTPVKHLVPFSSKDSIPPDTVIIDFDTRVKPIFVSHCSPCHFTGGKMYERLPFDKDTTIVAHGDAILRRIKEAGEKELIKQYIQQQGK